MADDDAPHGQADDPESGRSLVPSLDELRHLLDRAPHANIFQTSEMFEVFAHTRYCRPILLGSVGNDGSLRASVLSTIFLEPGGITHASLRGGPVSVAGQDGETGAREVLNSHETAVNWRTLYSRIYPLNEDNPPASLAESCGFSKGSWLNFIVPILDSKRQWDSLPKDRRRGIEKAQRANLKVRLARVNRDVDDLLRVLKMSSRVKGFRMQPRSLFQSVLEYLVPRGLARIVLAESNGVPIAARVVLRYKKTLYDWFAGSNPESRSLHPDEWLVWQALQWGRDEGCTTFDFGGAGVANVPYGPREFKSRFGGLETAYGRFTRLHYPKVTRLLDTVYNAYRSEVPL